MATNWNPATHPFRVLRIENTNAPGMHGWRSAGHVMYATLEEAVEAMNAKMPRGTRYVVIDQAQFDPAIGWPRSGRWVQVARRYPKEAARFSRGFRCPAGMETPDYLRGAL